MYSCVNRGGKKTHTHTHNLSNTDWEKKISPIEFPSITSIARREQISAATSEHLLFTNTHRNETNIILKETLDMWCICKFDFIGIAVK